MIFLGTPRRGMIIPPNRDAEVGDVAAAVGFVGHGLVTCLDSLLPPGSLLSLLVLVLVLELELELELTGGLAATSGYLYLRGCGLRTSAVSSLQTMRYLGVAPAATQ